MSPITTEASHPLPQRALETFAAAAAEAVRALYEGAPPVAVEFEAPRRPEFGDFATNVAFALAKVARRSPQDVATAIARETLERIPDADRIFASVEPVAGFINLRLSPGVWHAAAARALAQGENVGTMPPSGRRVSLEFGSANPTGPLVVVQGRTLSIGGTLANAMRMRGDDVFVEWIINDAGGQIETLGRSVYARYRQIFELEYPFPEEGYPGAYLLPIAETIAQRDGKQWLDEPEAAAIAAFAKIARDELVAQQRRTAHRFGVDYDLWQSEQELHDAGKIRAGIERLRALGMTYEEDGAVFARTTQFGDDKDRVVVRKDGRPTYFALDVTYHHEKLERRGYVIDILGPDHHGYVGRLKALAQAIGYDASAIDVLISGQVALVRGTEKVSMSKRAGEIVTLDDILDEVGVDAARFFFTMLSPESPLTFDLKLAVEKDAENPVYYVQYGHARIASVLRNAHPADVEAARSAPSLAPLQHASELALIRRLDEFAAVVNGVAEHLAPHRLARYARDVASDFHAFYTECRILAEDEATRRARLALCVATKNVLARALGLLGVSAPDSM